MRADRMPLERIMSAAAIPTSVNSHVPLGKCGKLSQRFRTALSIGGISFAVSSNCRRDLKLDPTLVPFCTENPAADIEIEVEWPETLASSMERPQFDSGRTWRLFERQTEFQFDFFMPMLGDRPIRRLVVDRRFRQATLSMNGQFEDLCQMMTPLGYPLDELLIMHRLTLERAIELHGLGIVGSDGMNNLFIGHSGAGKSTTARLWSSMLPVKILSDDRIIVREHNCEMVMYGTPWHGDACFALPESAPLHRIFILEHGKGNVISPLSRSQAIAELFARAFVPFHGHEYVESALNSLEHVASSLPCYRYSFEPQPSAVDKIFHFRD
jgi:hypothetical protein